MTTAETAAWYRWDELKRHEVTALAPEAIVVIPLGAIEQHGPYLPTGTDIMLSSTVLEHALDRAADMASRPGEGLRRPAVVRHCPASSVDL